MLVFLNVLRGVPLPPRQAVNGADILKTWWRPQGLKDAARVILDATPESVPADLEQQLVAMGRAIQVSPQDNDAEHIASHARAPGGRPPDAPRPQPRPHTRRRSSSSLRRCPGAARTGGPPRRGRRPA